MRHLAGIVIAADFEAMACPTCRTVRPLVAGNWKMNGLSGRARPRRSRCATRIGGRAGFAAVDVMICPPATLIAALADAAQGSRLIGRRPGLPRQCSGANTGDISAEMLADAGASAVIVGHSERRADHGETRPGRAGQGAAAHRAGLMAIVCIGETAGERSAGLTLQVVGRQLDGLAAGGRDGRQYSHRLRAGLGDRHRPDADGRRRRRGAPLDPRGARRALGAEGRRMRILYGGSVKPSNAKELMGVANVNGALVGGASLKADDFLGIIAAYR